MTTNKVFSLITFLILLNNGMAQTAREIPDRPTKVYNGPTGHGIGVILSASNGKGLTYRYWKQKYGFHASFFPASRNDYKYYNAGLTGYCKLRQYEIGTLFLHAGAEYVYSSLPDLYYNNQTGVSTSFDNITNGLNIGAGPGLHITQKYISFDLFLGYGQYIKNRRSSVDGIEPDDDVITTITAGIAIFLEL